MDLENQGEQQVDIQAPKWAVWGGKILGLFASFSWMFGAFWNFFHLFSKWTCLVAAILAILFGISLWCIELAVLVTWGPCMPVTKPIAEKTANFKIWQKAAFNFVGGMTTFFFCTSTAAANAFGFCVT